MRRIALRITSAQWTRLFTFPCLVWCAALILVGCGTEDSSAELEAEIALLEERLAAVESSSTTIEQEAGEPQQRATGVPVPSRSPEPEPTATPRPTVVPSPTPVPIFRTDAIGRVNVRNEPGGAVVGQLYATHQVLVTGEEVRRADLEETFWVPVEVDGLVGWVASRLLTPWSSGDEARFQERSIEAALGDRRSAAVASNDLYPSVASLFRKYTAAVNRGAYADAFNLRSGNINGQPGGFAAFSEAMRTTELSDFVIGQIYESGGAIIATASFVSTQAGSLGADGQHCSLWAIEYRLVRNGNAGLLIDGADLLDKDGPLSCNSVGLPADARPSVPGTNTAATPRPQATPRPTTNSDVLFSCSDRTGDVAVDGGSGFNRSPSAEPWLDLRSVEVDETSGGGLTVTFEVDGSVPSRGEDIVWQATATARDGDIDFYQFSLIGSQRSAEAIYNYNFKSISFDVSGSTIELSVPASLTPPSNAAWEAGTASFHSASPWYELTDDC